jgi:hypothetical protein
MPQRCLRPAQFPPSLTAAALAARSLQKGKDAVPSMASLRELAAKYRRDLPGGAAAAPAPAHTAAGAWPAAAAAAAAAFAPPPRRPTWLHWLL